MKEHETYVYVYPMEKAPLGALDHEIHNAFVDAVHEGWLEKSIVRKDHRVI